MDSIAAEGHNGLLIRGDYNGEECMVAAHQSNLTLMCVATTPTKTKPARKIGFYVDGDEVSPGGS